MDDAPVSAAESSAVFVGSPRAGGSSASAAESLAVFAGWPWLDDAPVSAESLAVFVGWPWIGAFPEGSAETFARAGVEAFAVDPVACVLSGSRAEGEGLLARGSVGVSGSAVDETGDELGAEFSTDLVGPGAGRSAPSSAWTLPGAVDEEEDTSVVAEGVALVVAVGVR